MITKKPWGYEEILFRQSGRTVKKIVIKPNHRLSLQFHENKIESLMILKGTAFIDDGEMIKEIKGIITIQPTEVHRFSSTSGATLLEMSIGDDKDIIRLEDDYGRD